MPELVLTPFLLPMYLADDRVLTNNFSMMNATNAAYYQYCLGGKEGYTEASQSTLICAAQKDNTTLIAVVLQGASVPLPQKRFLF